MKTRLQLIQEYRMRQLLKELARKRVKAQRRGFWTQEDIDHSYAWAAVMHAKINQRPLLPEDY